MTRQELLVHTQTLLYGPREDDYGAPKDSLHRIGKLWSSYLGVNISEVDVAAMMVLLKVARVRRGFGSTLDGWADMTGYAAIGAEAQEPPIFYNGTTDDK